MEDTDFVLDTERIVALLEKMAERGITSSESKRNSYDNIVVTPEETKEIGLFCLKYRRILDQCGKYPILDIFNTGEKHTTVSLLRKLHYLSHKTTSDTYCITVISDLEAAISDVIKNAIEY